MGTSWVRDMRAACRAAASVRGSRRRYIVIVWPSTINRALVVSRTDSKPFAIDWARRWYPCASSRGSQVYDRRARRVVLDTHAREMARRWASRLGNYA